MVGTRPDAIKSAPVICELRKYDAVETVIFSTGQHREMLAQALATFDLKADENLDIMQPGQSLAQITSRSLEGLDRLYQQYEPKLVLAQGDTTTTFVAGLTAFYRQIPFCHIEAGLRTDSIYNPFPEEFNRRAVAPFAEQHYAPTREAADRLLHERIPPYRVFVTGNTGIDAVLRVAENTTQHWYADSSERIVLLTTHRRENWGRPQEQIARAALELVRRFADIRLVVAMHRNPDVRATLLGILEGHDRVDLIEPPDYADFVKLMQRSTLILSDSGGVQEEAPAFKIPVLVLRETTERPEGVEMGVAKLVGADYDRIVEEAFALLESPAALDAMMAVGSPYGDGGAAKRIRYLVLELLGIESPQESMWI